MLSIVIDGQPVFIAKGTSIRLQMQNNAFSTERMEGDILFTFDIPAVKNDLVFRHARHVYVQRFKKYECSLLAGGVEIAKGDLYLQKTSAAQYSCGLVLNPLPQDFSELKLSENDYGDAVVISRNDREHRQKWKEFLRKSLEEDSVYKFPLFVDSAFYGSSNEDFGWYLLPSDNPDGSNPSGFQASLNTDDSMGLDKHYVNRLFVNGAGGLEEIFSETNRGIRLFNNDAVSNPNSFAFAPALRLVWILEKVLKNAGYRLCGNFHSDSDIQRLFSQSLRALDGLPSQYEDTAAGANVSIEPPPAFNSHPDDELTLYFDAGGESRLCCFVPQVSGNYRFNVSINTYLPANFLSQGADPDDEGMSYKEAVIFMVMESHEDFPNFLEGYTNQDWNLGIGYMENGVWTRFPNYFKIQTPDLLRSQIGYTGAGFYSFNYNFTEDLAANREYRFFFGKVRGTTADSIHLTYLAHYQNIPITQDVAAYYKVFNAFANKLKHAEHLPDLTNGEFLTRLCNAFGLAMFMESASGQVELSFFKDILNSPQSLDLTRYLLTDESTIEKYEPKKYVFKTECLHSEDIDETKLLPAVRTSAQLPDPTVNFGKVCFVENENQFRIAERIGDAVANWLFTWNPYSGNNQRLEIGEGDVEEISAGFISPNMKITDEKNYCKNFILQIEAGGCSPVFNTGNTGFDMVLVNYHGREELRFNGGRVYYENASPACIGKNGEPKGGIGLSAAGERSLERFVSPWLEFLSSHEKIRHRFIFPLVIFLEVIRLLKPQDVAPQRQTRWALVGNVRLLPVKMDFQFTEGSGNIIAEIEFAKEVVGL